MRKYARIGTAARIYWRTGLLFNHIHQRDKWGKSAEELRSMYFLTAINLKKDGETFWVVLGPALDVDSIFNHFLRFTLVKYEIIWSNLI